MKQILGKIPSRLLSLNSAELALFSFLSVSLLGAMLLMGTEHGHITINPLPVHQEIIITPVIGGDERRDIHTTVAFTENEGLRFVDAWFTAVSALCVTGLTVVDFSQFTFAGQLIVMLLIQIGGLGIFVFTSILIVAFFRDIEQNASFRRVLASTVDSRRYDAVRMLKYITIYCVILEVSAILVMGIYLDWIAVNPPLDHLNPWWWSVFHAISAFNNAGFSLMPNNLMNFTYDPTINLSITFLIIFGGLGFPVLIAFFMAIDRQFRHCEKNQDDTGNISGIASIVQVKIAIYGTIILLVIGTALTYWVDFSNSTEDYHNFFIRILPAWFQTVSTRTAGFNTVDVGAMHVPTLFLFMLLMFIGGNPAGTAGGIKIPTVAVLYAYLIDWFRKPGQAVQLFGQPVSRFAVSHAVRLFFFATVFISIMTASINYIERDFVITGDPTFSFLKVLFEVVSAFGTVGMSMGFPDSATSFSALLSDFSKYLVIITMFFGRIGPLVLLAALPCKRRYAHFPRSEDYPGAQKVQIG